MSSSPTRSTCDVTKRSPVAVQRRYANRLGLASEQCSRSREGRSFDGRVDTARSISTDQLVGSYEVVVTGLTVAETVLEQVGRLKSIRRQRMDSL